MDKCPFLGSPLALHSLSSAFGFFGGAQGPLDFTDPFGDTDFSGLVPLRYLPFLSPHYLVDEWVKLESVVYFPASPMRNRLTFLTSTKGWLNLKSYNTWTTIAATIFFKFNKGRSQKFHPLAKECQLQALYVASHS